MKQKLLLLAFVASAFMWSCSSDDDSSSSGIDHSKIYGWWYRNDNTATISYNAYYFGQDGVYKQDMSNFGLADGIGTWEWTEGDHIQITPTPGGGIAGGQVHSAVLMLTNDSLVFHNEQLRLSKNNPN
jgi:hypothetical protein